MIETPTKPLNLPRTIKKCSVYVGRAKKKTVLTSFTVRSKLIFNSQFKNKLKFVLSGIKIENRYVMLNNYFIP